MVKRNLFSSEKGYTLAFALGVILILMILGAMFTTVIYNEMLQFSRHKEVTQAYYLAEAGVNHALWNLNNSFSGTVGSESVPVSLGDGSYYTHYDTNSQTLTSAGTVNGVTKKIITHLKVTVVPSSFDRAVTGGRHFNSVPGGALATPDNPWNPAYSGVFIHNATTDFAKVLVVNCGSNVLNIHGYVVNDEKESNPYDPEYLGYVWDEDGVEPSGNIYSPTNLYPDAHFKVSSEPEDVGLPAFNTSYYESEIVQADAGGDLGPVTWNSYTEFTAGTTKRIKGDLTITGCTVASSDPNGSPVTIVASGKVTIENATIGGNIHIIAGNIGVSPSESAFEINGTYGTPIQWTTLGDETQLYSHGDTEVNDYVRTTGKDTPGTTDDDGETIIFSREETTICSDDGNDEYTYHINIDGIIFAKEKITLSNKSSSQAGNIYIGGCVVAGDAGSDDGRIEFPNVTHRIDVVFSRGAVPSGFPQAFQIIDGVVVDYPTWREK